MAIAKENDLLSSICIVKILYQEFYVMLCFCEMYFVFRCAKKFRILLFLCEFSHQQRNNISGLAARYKIFGVNAHKEIINVLLTQIQNTCRCRIRWEHSFNCITSCIVATLPMDYLLFIYLCFMLCFFPCDLYSDANILLVLLRQRLILAVSPIVSLTHLIPDVCGCHVLRILVVAVCRLGDVCCLPAPTH